MKLPYLLLLFILSLFSFSCSSSPEEQLEEAREQEEEKDALHIHFQQGFHQDTVILYHAGEKIYEQSLTSGQEKAPTDRFSIPRDEITDTIYFKVKQERGELQGYIPPKAERYVGFFLTSGSVVNIYSRPVPFEYQ